MHKISENCTTTNILIVFLIMAYCITFMLVASSSFELFINPDIGSQLSKGQEILNGRHPYIEIDSSVYGPAVFYMSAIGQYINNQILLPEVVFIFIGYLIAYFLFFKIFIIYAKSKLMLLAFAFLCLAAFPRFHKYYILLGPAIFYLGLHFSVYSKRPLFVIAILVISCVVVGVFRVDYGVYSVLASLLLIVLKYYDLGYIRLLRLSGVFFLSMLALLSPWLIFLSSNTNLLDVIIVFYKTTVGAHSGLSKSLPAYDFQNSPLTGQNQFNIMFWIIKYSPLIVIVYVLFSSYIKWNAVKVSQSTTDVDKTYNNKFLNNESLFLLVASVAAYLFFQQANHRIDIPHLKQVFPPVLFIMFIALSRLIINRKKQYAALYGLFIIVMTVFFIDGMKHRKLIKINSKFVSNIQSTYNSWKLDKAEIIESLIHRKHPSKAKYLALALNSVRKTTNENDDVLFLPFMAQTYYFSNRGYATWFGWLNPGRFIHPGTEKRFIDSMNTTTHIVDNVKFSFDGRYDRNMRSYAIQLTKFIYSNYGIYQVIGPYTLLSNNASVFKDYGEYELQFIKYKMPAQASVIDSKEAGLKIEAINTLPIADYGSNYMMPSKAGMLINIDKENNSKVKNKCIYLAITDNNSFYYIGNVKNKPVNAYDIHMHTLISTYSVSPGIYSLISINTDCFDKIEDILIKSDIKINNTDISINYVLTE